MSTVTETFTFSDLKAALTNNFKKMSSGKPFYVSIDKDEVWEQYLSGFDEGVRQEHNCNSCKSFLRQFAGIVTIVNDKVVSLWDDLEVSQEYQKAVDNLKSYIHSRPITDVFLYSQKKCGTDKNIDFTSKVTWNHFFIELPSLAVKSADQIGTLQGQLRDDKNVLKRSLDELTVEATETVLELIGQGSLYRGNEFKGLLESFLAVQKKYKNVAEKDNFCWKTSVDNSPALNRIRNTAIGTLLIDLSEGLELDAAVSKYEKVVAPTNYKRPTSLVTPKMVEQAKAKLQELGLLESLERRYANETDLSVNNVLFTDKPSTLVDIFAAVSKETIVNPRSFSKVEEIGIDDFLNNVLPHAKSLSILLENNHLSNFVSLITSNDKDAPPLFKWSNNFSWSYTGAIADSIKERVKAAGGNVVGELRTSLSWFNTDDLDIHVIEPGGNEIWYQNKRFVHNSSGMLDVDMNVGGESRTPVENIIWTNKSRMKEGTYTVKINNFTKRETKDSGFVVQIECAGEVFDLEYSTNPADRKDVVIEFNYSKTNGVTFFKEVKSNVVSKDKWGIKTSQFHKVTKLMLSPNYWDDNKAGNKHWFFMLENCVSDEIPRPFFNEFLKPELDENRKVFEILAGKIKIDETSNQLSGIGFSDTKRSSMIVKVEGKFVRTLKVNF